MTWNLLDKLPQSKLGRLHKCHSLEEILDIADDYDPEQNEFYFNRQPRNFSCVLNFLTTGKLHLGEETCVIAFSQVRSIKYLARETNRIACIILNPNDNLESVVCNAALDFY